MSNRSVKMSVKEEEEINKTNAELEEILSKFGWKSATLISIIGKIHKKGKFVSNL